MTEALALQEASADAIAADAPGRVADHRLRKSEQAFGASKGSPARSVQPQGRIVKKGGDRQSQSESVAKGGQRNGSQQKAIGKADGRKDAAGAFASPLKLTMGGYRQNSTGTGASIHTYGFYWSRTTSGTGSHVLRIHSTIVASLTTMARGHGLSVRCIKD